jgi:ribonuclease HI
MAAFKALERCKKPGPITIYSDSHLLVNGCNEWLFNWKRNGWRNAKGLPVEHIDLWVLIDLYLQARQVTLKWVKARSGNPGNDVADALAKKGAVGETIDDPGSVKVSLPA